MTRYRRMEKKNSLTEQEAAVLQDETFILQLTIKTS